MSPDPTVTGVTLDPPGPVTLYHGSYVQFAATAHYSDGTTQPLGPMFGTTAAYPSTCSSSDPTVASFSNDSSMFGRCFAGDNGTATITVHMAESESGNPLAGASAAVTVVDPPPIVAPAGRFCLGFDAGTLDPYPEWTAIDAHPNLVTSYTIDRGRSYELDQTSAGHATVNVIDPDGILDPTNPAGPYHGQIRPMLQANLARRNPVTGAWEDRFRGFVEDYSYEIDPSQKYNRLTVSLVDMFDILANAQMMPGQFGALVDGQVNFPGGQLPRDRIGEILVDAGVPSHLTAVFRGNVHLQQGVYSTTETALTAIQDAADGEFPAVANVFCDRHGRLSFHGRYARFDPAGVAALEPEWDYHHWTAGDGAAVDASPSTVAHVRALSFQRGVSKIINSAIATEQGAPDDTSSRQVLDTASINTFGMRSWTASNLLTNSGDLTRPYPTSAATETKRFAMFYVANYAQPRDRISSLQFKSLHPADARAAANWDLLSRVDISDTITITVAAAGGGGFHSEGYFVEGVHEQVNRLAPGYDEVVLSLDLSPRSYYGVNPWDEPLSSPDPSPASNNPTRKKTHKRAPHYHADSHEHGSPDPLGIHYEQPAGTDIGGGDIDVIPYSISGTLTVAAGGLRWYALDPGTILQIHASLGTSGGGATVAVNRNGSAIATVAISAGANVSSTVPADPAVAVGDYFTVDVTAAGGGAADLVVELQVQQG